MEPNELEYLTEDHLSIHDYIRILLRSRWIIISSFILLLIAAYLINLNKEPVYQAVTSLIIDQNGVMERTIFDYTAFGKQNTLIANQMEIIKSRNLTERVAKRLDLSDLRDSLRLFMPNEDGEYRYQSMGQLFLVKFGDRPNDPIWPVDIAVWQKDEAPRIIGQLLHDAQPGFPIPDFPSSIQKAHDLAHISHLEISVIQDILLNELSSNLNPEEKEKLFRLKHLGENLLNRRYKNA